MAFRSFKSLLGRRNCFYVIVIVFISFLSLKSQIHSVTKIRYKYTRAITRNMSSTEIYADSHFTSKQTYLASTTSLPILNSQKPNLKLCPLVPPNLVGPIAVIKKPIPLKEIEDKNLDLSVGGRWKPPNCTARHRVAIVIPFRDREEHLRIFLNNMHQFFKKQQLDYGVYVIEEVAGIKFNRGMLRNIGFVEALKVYDYQCFVFHDVDMLPENDKILYTCQDQPMHLSVAVDKFKYRLPYLDIFGGVISLKTEHFKLVNGYSNKYWEWGGEDDDLSSRVRNNGLKILRYPVEIARYVMIPHKHDPKDAKRTDFLFNTGPKRAKQDGLSSLKYKRLALKFRSTYTWIKVEINEDEKGLKSHENQTNKET